MVSLNLVINKLLFLTLLIIVLALEIAIIISVIRTLIWFIEKIF